MALTLKQENSNCDTNHQINNNYLERDKNKAAYLEYEDFSHTGLGLETYTDGVQHPLELRKILIGDLSKEMSVSFRIKPEENFKALVHPNSGRHGVEIYDSSGRVVTSFDSIIPKPPKLVKASSTITPFSGGLWEPEPSLETFQREDDDIQALINHQQQQQQRFRRPGRPPAQQGTFDPESGTIRYVCRLECGASLASAKGRRKHEKKHCPNVPKEQFGGFPMYYSGGSNLMGHSLFGGRVPIKKQEWFECRICGKILKTYEGRRLHEKLQHLPKKNLQTQQSSKQEDTGTGENTSSTDNQDDEIIIAEDSYVEEEDDDDDDDEVEDDLDDDDVQEEEQ